MKISRWRTSIGQPPRTPLATIEAMKMENVLRAEMNATVKKIKVAPGASLAVDEVIMEFE